MLLFYLRKAWGRVAGKLLIGERSERVDQQLAEHDPSECPGVQEGQQYPGLNQEWCDQQNEGSDCVLGTGEATP